MCPHEHCVAVKLLFYWLLLSSYSPPTINHHLQLITTYDCVGGVPQHSLILHKWSRLATLHTFVTKYHTPYLAFQLQAERFLRDSPPVCLQCASLSQFENCGIVLGTLKYMDSRSLRTWLALLLGIEPNDVASGDNKHGFRPPKFAKRSVNPLSMMVLYCDKNIIVSVHLLCCW